MTSLENLMKLLTSLGHLNFVRYIGEYGSGNLEKIETKGVSHLKVHKNGNCLKCLTSISSNPAIFKVSIREGPVKGVT